MSDSGVPVTYIDASGCHVPQFVDVRDAIEAKYKQIYGNDVYLGNDTQDGQFLQLMALAIHDANNMALAAYNSFSPTTAQGVGLSRNVKINGIKRNIPTYSTVDLTIVGVIGTIIKNGIVRDAQGYSWALPPVVTIPDSGQVVVTATCQTIGAVRPSINEVSQIGTVTPGWQSVTNLGAVTPGAPVETDAQLRARQAFSASLPALSVEQGLVAAIADIPGVSRYRVYGNDQPATDELGIFGHSVAVVVEGGDIQAVADTIALKKGEGVNSFGITTLLSTADAYGIQRQVSFSVVDNIPITYYLQVRTKAGYTSDVNARIKQALADWTTGLGIGMDVLLVDAYVSIRLPGQLGENTFTVVPDSLRVSRDGTVPLPNDVSIGYNESPYCTPAYITIDLIG